MKKMGKLKKILTMDIKTMNSYLLIIIIVITIAVMGTTSYALFSYEKTSNNLIKLTVGEIELNNLDTSGANIPNLASGMIPVYYNNIDSTWRKADETNENSDHQWYSYASEGTTKGMWANAVTIDNSVVKISDLSGNNVNGTTVGNPTLDSEGLVLNGTTDGIYFENQLKDLFKSSNTIQMKVKRSETAVRDILFGNYSTSHSINYEINTSNNYRIHYNCTSSVESDLVGGVANYNKFILVTYVFDKVNSQIRVYEDSTLAYTFSYAGYKNYNYDFNSVYIGKDARNSSEAFKGTIEKVMIYNDALTIEEITNNINTDVGKVGTQNNGIVSDNLFLYYDFRDVRERLMSAPAGTAIPMEVINTMYVWIPRYKYTIFNYNANGSSTTPVQRIEVAFEAGTATTGEIECVDAISGAVGNVSETCKIKATDTTCTNATCNGKTYTHPAFTFGSQNLKGIWVGKFENSYSGGIQIKPNARSLVNTNLATFHNYIRSMETNTTKYGLDKSTDITLDTHMMKNMEWGAVAYLTNSKYGRYNADGTCITSGCEVWRNPITIGAPDWSSNSYATITGCSGITANPSKIQSTSCASGYAYNGANNNGNSSTTGNIYGLYDMNGGTSEYMMANMVNSSGTYNAQSSGLTSVETKYYDKYSYGTTQSDATAFKRGKLGDASKEILETIGDPGSWNFDTSRIVNNNYYWFERGGAFNSNSGLFAIQSLTGAASYMGSSRSVLVK